MVAVVDTLDSIGATAGSIPKAPRVLAYITGGQGVAWTAEQIAAATKRGDLVLRVDQSNSIAPYQRIITLIKDIERGASTIDAAVREAEERAALGLRTVFYCSLSDWPTVRLAIHGQLVEFIDYLIADWTGSRAQAVAFIAQHLRNGVIGVQYASPSSNPTLTIPGSRLTLARANVDLSVTLADWPTPRPAPKPTRKPARKVKGAGLAGALSTLALVLLNAHGSTHVTGLTPGESSAITAVVMAITAYLTPPR